MNLHESILELLKCEGFSFHDTQRMDIKLRNVADRIAANFIVCTKEVLTSDEAAIYMGISKSYLYKLTMRKEIPHYKPMGKMCYFNRLELEEWLQQNRCVTNGELNQINKELSY